MCQFRPQNHSLIQQNYRVSTLRGFSHEEARVSDLAHPWSSRYDRKRSSHLRDFNCYKTGNLGSTVGGRPSGARKRGVGQTLGTGELLINQKPLPGRCHQIHLLSVFTLSSIPPLPQSPDNSFFAWEHTPSVTPSSSLSSNFPFPSFSPFGTQTEPTPY